MVTFPPEKVFKNVIKWYFYSDRATSPTVSAFLCTHCSTLTHACSNNGESVTQPASQSKRPDTQTFVGWHSQGLVKSFVTSCMWHPWARQGYLKLIVIHITIETPWFWIVWIRGSMFIENNRGPRLHPWGAPNEQQKKSHVSPQWKLYVSIELLAKLLFLTSGDMS